MMKSVLQVVLLIGLAAPAFGAAPEIDFDGRGKANKSPSSFLNETAAVSKITPVSEKSNLPEVVRIMERLNENGEFVEIVPEIKLNEAGRKVATYTIQPSWAVRWGISCPGDGNWSKRITYAWDAAAGGHNHSNPPPPPLRFSNNQSAQLPTEWGYAPSPINFPVMQGLNKPYYYWVWYPVFATKLVEWSEAWGACVSSREKEIHVKVDGLVELKDGAGYVLSGTTTWHPSHHFVTTQFKTALQQIGKDWNSACPKSARLIYNDMSLIWGGKFDLWRQWGNTREEPHSGHKFGNNADISKRWVRKGNREKLIKLMCKYAEVYSEGDGKDEFPHYHMVLKTSKNAEDFPAPSDARYIPCCSPAGVPEACIDLQQNGTAYPETLPIITDCP
jgi:hypothetical protein